MNHQQPVITSEDGCDAPIDLVNNDALIAFTWIQKKLGESTDNQAEETRHTWYPETRHNVATFYQTVNIS